MKQPLTSMISRIILAKALVTHGIIRAKMVAQPIVVEALTRFVSFLHNSTWALPQEDKYTRLALESSRQLALEGDTSCWYAQKTFLFKIHGLNIDKLPPFQYSLDALSLTLTHQEINRIIRQDLI